MTTERSSTDLGAIGIGIPFTVSAQLRLELEELMDEVEPNGRACPDRDVPSALCELVAA